LLGFSLYTGATMLTAEQSLTAQVVIDL